MNNIIYLAMSEDSKKFITALLIVLLLILVLVGIVAGSIQKWSKKKAKEIDIYLYDMCKFQLLEKPKDVIKYTKERELKYFYLKNRWFFRAFFIVTIAFVLIVKFVYNNDYSQVWQVLVDLSFKLESPKAKFYFFNNFPTDWPVVTKKSVVHLDLLGYSVYVEMIAILVLIIETFKNTLVLKEKLKRVKNRAVNYFNPGIEDETK